MIRSALTTALATNPDANADELTDIIYGDADVPQPERLAVIRCELRRRAV